MQDAVAISEEVFFYEGRKTFVIKRRKPPLLVLISISHFKNTLKRA